jgi:hypothetical protein
LSPLLLCLVLDLTARLNGGGIYTQGYADDICFLAVEKFPNTVDTWCDEVGLSVNPDKTGFVVFTRRRKLPGFCATHFLGVTLRRSMSFKYLGVVTDSRLTRRDHVDVKGKKAHNLLRTCRRAYVATWGLRPRWSIGSASIMRPSILHLWFGGLAVRRLVPREDSAEYKDLHN